MHDFVPAWLALLAALGVLATFLALALRPRQAMRRLAQRTPRDSALPPISPDDAQRILAQARSAAMARAMEHAEPRNPHPPGTRARILWETEFWRVLMDITH